MCGRCASSRDAQGVRHACAYRTQGQKGAGGGSGKAVLPTWLQCSPQQQYYPSYNISPQANTPVLVSGHHPHVLEYQKSFKAANSTSHTSEAVEQRVLQTMKWGLIPSWHRGTPSSFGKVLNNCRYETMLEKPSFRIAVQKGRRCVVVADGFYEWNHSQAQSQPYFIYFADNAPTEEMLEVSAARETAEEMLEVSAARETAVGGGEEEGKEVKEKTRAAEAVGSRNVWEHPTGRMLTMAGLFDILGSEQGDPLFTYTVITVEAQPAFSQIHHRMPAVLDGQEAVQTWLDPSRSTREVYGLLQPVDCLDWHRVFTVVNNSRNNTAECVLPFDVHKQASGQKTTLLNWFSKSPRPSGPSSDLSPLTKRPRLHPSQ